MPTARVSQPTRSVLRKLSEESGESMQAILDKAVEMYRRHHFLEDSNRAFEVLRANPAAWEAEQAEREAWDDTLADDLEKK
jgi:hypothetical protein